MQLDDHLDWLHFDTYYRKRGSASYIVREVLLVREREREIQRETDGSDVTIVALKLAMSLHFPLPKIRTWRWVYTFPCQKIALFVSPFTLPISPFLYRHHCGAEIHNHEWVLTFRSQKFRPLCSDLSSGAIVLPIEKMNQINTKNYWK